MESLISKFESKFILTNDANRHLYSSKVEECFYIGGTDYIEQRKDTFFPTDGLFKFIDSFGRKVFIIGDYLIF